MSSSRHSRTYYRVGGFQSNFKLKSINPPIPYTAKEIAEALLVQKAGIDLILGVQPCGASYLLLPREDAEAAFHHLFKGYGTPATEYLSLSPIHFEDSTAFAAKLTKLANKTTAQKKKKDQDRSHANTQYVLGADPFALTLSGISRANFEYHRLFLRILRDEIERPYDYDIVIPTWLQNIRAVSLAYNLWELDHRPQELRRTDPKVLDIGWTEYALPNPTNPGPIATSTVHAKLSENRLLRAPNYQEFAYGETEHASKEVIATHLKQLFNVQLEDSSSPVVLFVYGAEGAMNVIRSFGLDISRWHRGIEPILGRRILKIPGTASYRDTEYSRREPNFSRDPYSRQRSGRSISPGRGDYSRRARSPELSQRPPPVYVVDVKDLYATMRDSGVLEENSSAIANNLRIYFEPQIQHKIGSDWSAGNESRLLGFMWFALACGNAIDEQRATRIAEGSLPMEDTEEKPQVPPVGQDMNSDDEDPNDAGPVSRGSTQNQAYKDPYAVFDEEDEDDDY